MNEKLMKYLDGVFAPYQDLYTVEGLKEELHVNLQEKVRDLKNQGYDDEAALRMTIDSVGDIEEIIESITDKTRELRQTVKRDLSTSNLQDSDLKGIAVQDGKFDMSDLRGSDFSNSDLVNASFKCSNLRNVRFDGADLTGARLNMSDLRNVSFNGADLTGAKIIMCNLKDSTFKNCVLNNTDFSSSDLSGICFENQTLNGTIFDKAGLAGTSFRNAVLRNVSFRNVPKKSILKAIFDGSTMDKLTYAALKGYNANLTNVTVS
ncbi:MAG: low-complexity protein [Desulfitibacter sp. BRH_c19]|nr:MAG: low-complexity protein [Desulfitibacter sp. BRH_c19]